jgi:RHS repeat-associated protein
MVLFCPIKYGSTESWAARPQGGNRHLGYDWDAFNRMLGIAGDRRGGSGNTAWVTDAWSEAYLYRADGLRVQKVYANSMDDPEQTSSAYDYNHVRNDTTWRYGYDGQMCNWEDYTLVDPTTGNPGVVDLTRYGLGARGVDLISAKRTTSETENDPLMTAVTSDPVLGSTNERVSFPIYDGHGNTIATLSRTGTGYAVANENHYDAWGKVRYDGGTGSSGQILNPDQRYCGNLGHKYDSTNGLIYMRARYYEAETGRLISEDPARDGANWYGYCDCDPVNQVDRTGRSKDVLEATADAVEKLLKYLQDQGLPVPKTAEKIAKIVNAAIQMCALKDGAVASYAFAQTMFAIAPGMLAFETLLPGLGGPASIACYAIGAASLGISCVCAVGILLTMRNVMLDLYTMDAMDPE